MPAQFTFGNAPRNILRGPKSVSTDLSLVKNFPLGGGAQLQLRAEIFNVFNNVNYGNPNGTFGSANFGRISSAGSMRQVQLGGKVSVLTNCQPVRRATVLRATCFVTRATVQRAKATCPAREHVARNARAHIRT